MKRIAIIVVLVLSFFASSAYAQPTADEKAVAKIALSYLVKKIQTEYVANQKEQEEVHAQFAKLVQKIEKKQHVQKGMVQSNADESVFDVAHVAQISKSAQNNNHNFIIMVVLVVILTLTFKKHNFRRAIAMLTCVTFLSSCAAGTINIVNLRGGKVEQLGEKIKFFVEYKIVHKEGGITQERDVNRTKNNRVPKGDQLVSKITVRNPKWLKFSVYAIYAGIKKPVEIVKKSSVQKWMKDYTLNYLPGKVKVHFVLKTEDKTLLSSELEYQYIQPEKLQPETKANLPAKNEIAAPKGLKIKPKTKNQKIKHLIQKQSKALQRRTVPTKLKIVYEQDPKKFQVFLLEQNVVIFSGVHDVRVRLKDGSTELYHGHSSVNLKYKVNKVRFIQIGKIMASNFYVMGSAII